MVCARVCASNACKGPKNSLTLTGFLINVSSSDPTLFINVALLLTAIGLFACWLPARRAAAVEPVIAWRDA